MALLTSADQLFPVEARGLSGKTLLITGGTGSFGQAMTKLLLDTQNPHAVRIFSRGEYAQEEMRATFNNDSRLRFLIGDVRDRVRLTGAMMGVDYVIHAAALKQVPAGEYNPTEFVDTNVQGSRNVMECADAAGVKRALLISTDKSVHPSTLYGATKMVAERLFAQGNTMHPNGPAYGVVRYGNVVGSRGSVVNKFLEICRDREPLPITNPKMMRFWLTVEQGARFALSTLMGMKGGQIFVPKLPKMDIAGVADAVTEVVTGLPHRSASRMPVRSGEKLSEELISIEEARWAYNLGDRYVLSPGGPPSHESCPPSLRGLSEECVPWKTPDDWPGYSCATSDWELSHTEMVHMIHGLKLTQREKRLG